MSENDPIKMQVKKDAVVVTAEEGVVLTGTQVSAFEGRVVRAIRRPFWLVAGLLLAVFVIVVGASLVITDLDTKVDEINTVAQSFNSGDAQARQAAAIQSLLDGFSCTQQTNLQRAIDEIAKLEDKPTVNIVEDKCLPASGA